MCPRGWQATKATQLEWARKDAEVTYKSSLECSEHATQTAEGGTQHGAGFAVWVNSPRADAVYFVREHAARPPDHAANAGARDVPHQGAPEGVPPTAAVPAHEAHGQRVRAGLHEAAGTPRNEWQQHVMDLSPAAWQRREASAELASDRGATPPSTAGSLSAGTPPHKGHRALATRPASSPGTHATPPGSAAKSCSARTPSRVAGSPPIGPRGRSPRPSWCFRP